VKNFEFIFFYREMVVDFKKWCEIIDEDYEIYKKYKWAWISNLSLSCIGYELNMSEKNEFKWWKKTFRYMEKYNDEFNKLIIEKLFMNIKIYGWYFRKYDEVLVKYCKNKIENNELVLKYIDKIIGVKNVKLCDGGYVWLYMSIAKGEMVNNEIYKRAVTKEMGLEELKILRMNIKRNKLRVRSNWEIEI
jgi:hypothetical protein